MSFLNYGDPDERAHNLPDWGRRLPVKQQAQLVVANSVIQNGLREAEFERKLDELDSESLFYEEEDYEREEGG